MAKQKTYEEELLSEFKKGQKLVKESVSKMETRFSSLNNRIKYLEKQIEQHDNELEKQKQFYEDRFFDIFGINFENYLVGYSFEKHVVWWMNQYHKDYELKIWQGDKYFHPYENGDKIYASWNKYPDVIYVNSAKKKVIALECKYRKDGILKVDKNKYMDYLSFEKQISSLMKVEAKVYIMVGSSGTPDKPDFMYCIPIHLFEKTNTVDLRKLPQYQVMGRGYYDSSIYNLLQNCPF